MAPAVYPSPHGRENEDWLAVPLTVDAGFDGYRLDRFLKARIARLSRNRIQTIIERGQILDDAGEPLRRVSTRVHSGQALVLLRPMPVEPPVTLDYAELYRDESLLVIDKPSGLPVHPSARYFKHTLTALMRERLGEEHGWELAHRLDRETSGVLLLGRRRVDRRRRAAPASGGVLQRAFQTRAVKKEYLAICRGTLGAAQRIDAPLALDPTAMVSVKMGVVPTEDGGLPSTTDVEPLAQGEHLGEAITLVRCLPRTGRQHQIRVHLDFVGHPLLGDKLYGVDEQLFIDMADGRLSMGEVEKRVGLSRQALHAHQVWFPHPGTGEEVSFRAPWPEALAEVLPLPSSCS